MSEKTDEVSITIDPISLGGSRWETEATERKVKGKEEKRVIVCPKIPVGSVYSTLVKELGDNGAELLEQVLIREVVRPAAAAASSVAFTAGEDGSPEFQEEAWLKEFRNQFQPGSRTSGGLSKADIIERMLAIQPRFLELAQLSSERQLSEEENQEFMRLAIETQQWTTKLEEKTRGAAVKKAKKAKEKKEEVPAAA